MLPLLITRLGYARKYASLLDLGFEESCSQSAFRVLKNALIPANRRNVQLQSLCPLFGLSYLPVPTSTTTGNHAK